MGRNNWALNGSTTLGTTLCCKLKFGLWRNGNDANETVQISDVETDDTMPLSALNTVDAQKAEKPKSSVPESSSAQEKSPKTWQQERRTLRRRRMRWSIMGRGGLESCMMSFVPRPMTSTSTTSLRSSIQRLKCLWRP
eukprot:183882-Amphidinium_carterae.3